MRFPRAGPAALALAAGVLVAGCQFVPPQLRGGESIVMEVKNGGQVPASLAVASIGNAGDVVGSAEPALVLPGQTATVSFYVPRAGQWAIWVNGKELMGEPDLRGKRGAVPMGIEIGPNGEPVWWCQRDCP